MHKEQLLKLLTAIETDDLDFLEELLANGERDWMTRPLIKGLYAIHQAARLGKIKIVELLLANNPTLLNALDPHGQTPLLWAAVHNQVEMVYYLANEGADLNLPTQCPQTNDHGKTPVHWATERGHLVTLTILLHFQANPHVVGHSHFIHIASIEGHWEIIKFILSKDPNLINAKDYNYMTPLAYAAANGHLILTKHLLRLGADLAIETKGAGANVEKFLPIHWAIAKGQFEVFDYLLTFYPKDYILDRDGSYYIHIAAQFGQLELVQSLLKNNPKYLEYKNFYNQTPLMVAAKEGQDKVVKYLLAEGADYSVATRNPDSVENKMTALQLAKNGCHYTTANQLVLKISKEDEDTIIFLVRNGEQALELMLEKPNLIKPFLKNRRIAKLINEDGSCDTTVQPMQWYRPRTSRRLSFFGFIDKIEKESSRFEPVINIAKGKFGDVRRFKNDKEESIAVKSPVKDFVDLTADALKVLHNRMKRELEFNQIAYPDDKDRMSLFKIFYQKDNKNIYSNRLILPFIDGEEAHKFIYKLACEYQLAQVILQIALELNRIHELGIMHGDIFARNILINRVNNSFNVRIIDFGRSYFAHELVGSNTLPSKGIAWYAPELFGHGPVVPNRNQDIYSFGHFLKKVLDKHGLQSQVLNSFPSIEKFYVAAQNIRPKERPALEAFCNELMIEIQTNDVQSNQTLRC